MEVTTGQFPRSEDAHIGRQARCEEGWGETVSGKALEGAGGGLGVKSKVMGEIRRDGQCTCGVVSSCGL